MKSYPLLIALGGLSMLGACSSEPKDLPVMEMSANVGIANTVDTASVISLELAMLPEATDSTLLQYPSLAGIIDGNYYIHSKALMIFDDGGKCLMSANRVGQGPEEYGEYARAYANKATGGWVVTAYPFGVKNYTRDAKFISTDFLPASNALCQLGEDWAATNNPLTTDTVCIYYYDKHFQLTDTLKTHLKQRTYKVNGGITGLNSHFYSYGKEAFIIRHDTVFSATDPKRGLVPTAIARFGDRMVPEDFDMAAHPNWFDEYIEPQYVFGKDYLLVMYAYERPNNVMQFYDLSTGELVLSLSNIISREKPGFEMDYNGGKIYISPLYKANGNKFYFSASEDQMSALTGQEDPNPGIFTIEIK